MRAILFNIRLIISIVGGLVFLYILFLNWRKKKQKPSYDIEVEAAKVIYVGREQEFEQYFKLWKDDKKTFFTTYADKFRNNSMPEFLTFMSVITAFGDIKKLFYTIDWKGEENERELEAFIEGQVGRKMAWPDTDKLRASVEEEKQRDGNFILQLFRAIDQDLQIQGYQLIFKDSDGDNYHFTILRKEAVDKVKIPFGYRLATQTH